jgi:hypothetical protein
MYSLVQIILGAGASPREGSRADMKKVPGLSFALLAIALAFALSSRASAQPVDSPNDDACICHQTPWSGKTPNASQKSLLICVDPDSLPRNKHFEHGDPCVQLGTELAPACDGQAITLEECTGEVACSLSDDPFRPECCAELVPDPNGSQQQCDGAADVNGCLACLSN